MPKLTYRNCRNCGKSTDEVGVLSHLRLCSECGRTRREENLDAMVTMRGPFAQWWALKVAASVGYAPLDDVMERP